MIQSRSAYARRPAAVFLAAVVLFLGAVPFAPSRATTFTAGQQRESRINLAVLRADGILLPFASFDGDDWRASWPSDLSGQDLPVNLASVPRSWWGGTEPGPWRLFTPDGGAPQQVTPGAPAMIRVGAAVRLGLRTDYAAAKMNVPPFAVAYPKTGLAVAGDVDIKPISIVSLAAPSSQALVQMVREEVNEVEERTIGALRSNTGWRHPIDTKVRASIGPQLEALYVTANAGAQVSYVEMAKKYPPGPKDEGCGLETFVTGWIMKDVKEERPKFDLKAIVVYCDRDRASYMLPLAHVIVRDRTYWIYQMSGQDHEWYAVAEAARNRVRVVAEYFAGGVPNPLR